MSNPLRFLNRIKESLSYFFVPRPRHQRYRHSSTPGDYFTLRYYLEALDGWIDRVNWERNFQTASSVTGKVVIGTLKFIGIAIVAVFAIVIYLIFMFLGGSSNS